MTPLLLAVLLSATNHAGRVVSGELTSVTNGTFVLSGRTYPLSILPKSERARVVDTASAASGRGGDAAKAASTKQRRLREAIRRDLDRARVRYEAGEMTDAAWAEKQAEAAAAISFQSSNK